MRRVAWKILSAVFGAIGLLCVPLLGSANSALPQRMGAKDSAVSLTIINCQEPRSAIPTIVARDVSNGNGREWTVVSDSQQVNKYLSVSVFRLPPGTYTIIVGQGGCSEIFDLTALAGLDRSIVVAPNRRVYKDLHEHNSISGSLPWNGLRAELLVCVSDLCDVRSGKGVQTIDAQVDGRAYYVNEVPPGTWYLRLLFDNASASVLIPVQGAERGTARYKHVERDFSASAMQTLWREQRLCATTSC